MSMKKMVDRRSRLFHRDRVLFLLIILISLLLGTIAQAGADNLVDANPELKKCLPDPRVSPKPVPIPGSSGNMCRETPRVNISDFNNWNNHLFDAASTATNPREITGRYDVKGKRCGGLPADTNCPIELRAAFEITCPRERDGTLSTALGSVLHTDQKVYCPRLQNIKIYHGTKQVLDSPGVAKLPFTTNFDTAAIIDYSKLLPQEYAEKYCKEITTKPDGHGGTLSYSNSPGSFRDYELLVPSGLDEDGSLHCAENPLAKDYKAVQDQTRCACAQALEIGEQCLALWKKDKNPADNQCTIAMVTNGVINEPLCKCEGTKQPEYLVGSRDSDPPPLRNPRQTVKMCINAGGQPYSLPDNAGKICKFPVSSDLTANLESIRKNDPKRVELNRPRVNALEHVRYLLSKSCPAGWQVYQDYSSTSSKSCMGSGDITSYHGFANKVPEVACCESDTTTACREYITTGCINGPSGNPQIYGTGNTDEGGLHHSNIDPKIRPDIYLNLANYSESGNSENWCYITACLDTGMSGGTSCNWIRSQYDHNQVAQINEVGCY